MKKVMEESYIDDSANRGGPRVALVSGEGAANVGVGVRAGRVIERRNRMCWGADVIGTTGRQRRDGVIREPFADPAGSEKLCMCVMALC